MRTRSRLAGAGAVLVAALAPRVAAQVTSRVSVATGGAQGNLGSEVSSISADGRFAAFASVATNLVSGDSNGSRDVFVRDRIAGTTERVSVDTTETQGNGASDKPSISADGRFVAFESLANNLVGGDSNGASDIFVRDRITGTTERVSVDSSAAQGIGASYEASISADGRCVAFRSSASNLVPGDTGAAVWGVFVHDRLTGATEFVDVDSSGAQADGNSYEPSISADGYFVAFFSYATNLVPGDTNARPDVFVRDRNTGTTERVSVDSSGAAGNNISFSPSISADDRFVAFQAFGNSLVAGDTNGKWDVFVHDRQTGTTERVSVDSAGMEGNDHSVEPSISPDGRFVAFESGASNLVGGDTNGAVDIFLRDRLNGSTERVSVDSLGAEGNGGSSDSSISADARFVSFTGYSSNLVGGDTNATWDIFARDRDATGLTSLCDPGQGNVIACPCSNPASGSGRGCDNSAATGGASLTAAGVAYLSMDSLVFTASGERPIALSVVAQWTGTSASGAVFGMGVRCTSGILKRLYTKQAAGGSITAPDYFAGDVEVSLRSAALGDPILAGESRWYLVYYRDPIVLGGCPASGTFNATQTGRVTWSQ